jgi:phage terminase small subunit
MPKSKLSAKHERFVAEYLVDLNAAAAYRRAGYKAKDDHTAAANAARLIAKDSIQQTITAAAAKVIDKLEVDAANVTEEWVCIAHSDIGDILDFSGDVPKMRSAHEIPAKARRAISGFKTRRVVEGKGEDARTVEISEFKYWDKLGALEKLAKLKGLLKDSDQSPAGPAFKVYIGQSPDDL